MRKSEDLYKVFQKQVSFSTELHVSATASYVLPIYVQ
jgi:hypothetical protein